MTRAKIIFSIFWIVYALGYLLLGFLQFHNEEYASACAKFMCAGFGLSLFCDRIMDIILAKMSK
jgi:hypothetical protein